MNKQLRSFKCLLIKLFRIKENAHKISLGFTLGFLVNFIPSFGIGPLLSTAGAKILKGNPLAGFIGGVLLIWLFPLLFYLNLIVGQTLLPFSADAIHPGGSFGASVQAGTAFLLGMLVNILLFGVLSYLFMYKIVIKYRVDLLSAIKKWNVKK